MTPARHPLGQPLSDAEVLAARHRDVHSSAQLLQRWAAADTNAAGFLQCVSKPANRVSTSVWELGAGADTFQQEASWLNPSGKRVGFWQLFATGGRDCVTFADLCALEALLHAYPCALLAYLVDRLTDDSFSHQLPTKAMAAFKVRGTFSLVCLSAV